MALLLTKQLTSFCVYQLYHPGTPRKFISTGYLKYIVHAIISISCDWRAVEVEGRGVGVGDEEYRIF